MGWPSVGVVLPTHDRPGPLRAALAAVLAQVYPGQLRAVVVYDRAEPDLGLAGGDRVRVAVNTRTPGLAGARNTGIGLLDTDLVAFCDDDDEWLPGKLLAQVQALRARPGDFDVVHDNQGLGYGMLGVRRLGVPLVTSIHHPISVDRRLDIAGRSWLQRLNKGRWYGFVRMQGRVARRVGPLITVSSSSQGDICRDFRVNPEKVHIIPLGVDTELFHPRTAHPRVAGRIVAVTSADSPLKGLPTLLRAVAKLVTEREAHLVVIGTPSAVTREQVAQLALADRVTFASGLPDAEYARALTSAQVAVIPSLYEGFSLPAVEHMASGTPLIASRAGALPEVTGDAALLVPPGDPEELAVALRGLLDDEQARAERAERGLARVRERFAWPAVAAATEALYRKVINEEPGC